MVHNYDKTLCVRLPAAAVTAIDAARQVGLFKRGRSEFIRDCIDFYVNTRPDTRSVVQAALKQAKLPPP